MMFRITFCWTIACAFSILLAYPIVSPAEAVSIELEVEKEAEIEASTLVHEFDESTETIMFEETTEATTLSFPRIYTAIVSTPPSASNNSASNHHDTSNDNRKNGEDDEFDDQMEFMTQINLIHSKPYQDEEDSHDDNGQPKQRWRKVAFLVRSQEQLDRIHSFLALLSSTATSIHNNTANNGAVTWNSKNHPFSKVRKMVHDTEATMELYNQLHYDFRQDQDFVLLTSSDRALTSQSGDGDSNNDYGLSVGSTTSSDTIPGFPCYRNLLGSFQAMDTLVKQVRSIPHLSLTKTDIGDSWQKTQDSSQGHDMIALHLTGTGVQTRNHHNDDSKNNNNNNNNNNKRKTRTTDKGILFIMSGIHAREYTPPELVLRWLEHMIDSYGIDADITSIIDHTDIHIVLQSNPDGRYVAETQKDLWWRKNLNCGKMHRRYKCQPDECGVDLNRNFPFFFGFGSGGSKNPCSDIYSGSKAASEPETKAIVNYTKSIFPSNQQRKRPKRQVGKAYPETNKGVFLDIHAYGNMLIYPWGYEEKLSGNDDDYRVLTGKLRHFNDYDFTGPFNGFSYQVSGGSKDYAYGMLGTAAYVFELGTTFYETCSVFTNDILPKNLPVLTYAAKISKAPFALPKGPDIVDINLSKQIVTHSLTIEATASDSMWDSGHHQQSQQQVEAIRVYVDIHPDDRTDDDDDATPSGYMMGGAYSSKTVVGVLVLDVSSLHAGRHTLYLQAQDSQGYVGPVTAVYFEKKRAEVSKQEEEQPCVDDNTAIFSVDTWTRNCLWLSMMANSLQREEYCEAGEPAHQMCKMTCDNCAIDIE